MIAATLGGSVFDDTTHFAVGPPDNKAHSHDDLNQRTIETLFLGWFLTVSAKPQNPYH